MEDVLVRAAVAAFDLEAVSLDSRRGWMGRCRDVQGFERPLQ